MKINEEYIQENFKTKTSLQVQEENQKQSEAWCFKFGKNVQWSSFYPQKKRTFPFRTGILDLDSNFGL